MTVGELNVLWLKFFVNDSQGDAGYQDVIDSRNALARVCKGFLVSIPLRRFLIGWIMMTYGFGLLYCSYFR